jgi:hypothetical protein
MLMRCFSESCKQRVREHNPERFLARGWVEVLEDDLAVVRAKRGARAPSPALSTASTASAATTTTTTTTTAAAAMCATWGEAEAGGSSSSGMDDDALVDLLVSMEHDEAQPPPQAWPTTLPRSAARWMRALLPESVRLTPLLPTHMVEPPPCLATLFRMGRATLLLHASAVQGLPFCARELMMRTYPSAANLKKAAADHHHHPPDPTTTVAIVAQTDPRCAGTTYRLFVLCRHPDCAHLRSPTHGPWAELQARHAPAARGHA